MIDIGGYSVDKDKTINLKVGNNNLPTSNNVNLTNTGKFHIIGENLDKSSVEIKAFNIITKDGVNAGWVYEYEIIGLTTNREDLITEAKHLKSSLEKVESKIEWMTENNIDDFDEDEFNVFETISLLENESMTKLEKSKLIAKLIKK